MTKDKSAQRVSEDELRAILGTDASLLDGAKRLQKRVAELEAEVEQLRAVEPTVLYDARVDGLLDRAEAAEKHVAELEVEVKQIDSVLACQRDIAIQHSRRADVSGKDAAYQRRHRKWALHEMYAWRLKYDAQWVRWATDSDLIALLREARDGLRALLVMMDRGTKPRKLDETLTWVQNDLKARTMATESIARIDAVLGESHD